MQIHGASRHKIALHASAVTILTKTESAAKSVISVEHGTSIQENAQVVMLDTNSLKEHALSFKESILNPKKISQTEIVLPMTEMESASHAGLITNFTATTARPQAKIHNVQITMEKHVTNANKDFNWTTTTSARLLNKEDIHHHRSVIDSKTANSVTVAVLNV